MKIRFAVTPPLSALHEDEFPKYLVACESLGFDTVWLSDIPLGSLGDPLLSLTYAAALTTKLKLGANIVPLGRHPLWLAKQLAQLDRMSQGRLLVSFVPGLGSPAERSALGYPKGDRGAVIDEMIELMRRWWAGESVSADWQAFQFVDARVQPLPVQSPLEVWLGGSSPAALRRVAAIADGWLTSAITPAEAGAGRQSIERAAQERGRTVDAEHFGISVPYAEQTVDEAALAALRARRKDGDLSEVVPVGEAGLKSLLAAHIDQGMSKFVVRPLDALSATSAWHDPLQRLADTVLPLQT